MARTRLPAARSRPGGGRKELLLAAEPARRSAVADVLRENVVNGRLKFKRATHNGLIHGAACRYPGFRAILDRWASWCGSAHGRARGFAGIDRWARTGAPTRSQSPTASARQSPAVPGYCDATPRGRRCRTNRCRSTPPISAPGWRLNFPCVDAHGSTSGGDHLPGGAMKACGPLRRAVLSVRVPSVRGPQCVGSRRCELVLCRLTGRLWLADPLSARYSGNLLTPALTRTPK